MRNAGSSTAGLVFERLDDRHEGVRMNYEEGDSCVNSFNKTVTFSTYIDFLCSQVYLLEIIEVSGVLSRYPKFVRKLLQSNSKEIRFLSRILLTDQVTYLSDITK